MEAVFGRQSGGMARDGGLQQARRVVARGAVQEILRLKVLI